MGGRGEISLAGGLDWEGIGVVDVDEARWMRKAACGVESGMILPKLVHLSLNEPCLNLLVNTPILQITLVNYI